MYIQQRQGRIPEATAKHFMQQLGLSEPSVSFAQLPFFACRVNDLLLLHELKHINVHAHVFAAASGLKILRDNNLIHRDLKPQVWLPSPLLF